LNRGKEEKPQKEESVDDRNLGLHKVAILRFKGKNLVEVGQRPSIPDRPEVACGKPGPLTQNVNKKKAICSTTKRPVSENAACQSCRKAHALRSGDPAYRVSVQKEGANEENLGVFR